MTQIKKLVGFLAVMFMVLMAVPLVSYAAEEPQTEKAWKKMADMNEPRFMFQAETVNGKIYVMGGSNGSKVISSVEMYDPSTDKWTMVAPMNTARWYFQTEVIDGKIYAIGGPNLSSMEVYDPSTDKWTVLAPMSIDRTNFQTEVVNGMIYAIGGNGGKTTLNTVERYDPATNKWTKMEPMSERRRDFQTELINGKIYAIGGTFNNATNTAEVYDTETNKWSSIASMSEARYGFQTEIINGKIYAFGSNGNELSSTVEEYNPIADQWTTLAPMSTAKKACQAIVINDKLFVIGGFTNGSLSITEVYNPDTNQWSSIASMNGARCNFQAVVLNNTLYAIGGSYNKALSSVEAYTLTSLPSPTNLTATAGNAQVVLTWDAVDGATSYKIKRSETEAGTYSPVTSVTGSAITFTDTGLTNGTTYYYTVSAVKSGEESADSNVAAATPKAPVNKLKLVLEVKQKKQLSVSEELSDNADMIWSSSESAVAAVDDNGMLKAIKPGNTVITCTSKDASYSETINVLVVDLDLQLAVDLKVGEKCRLTVDDLAEKAKVTWVSDDVTIAAVSAKGRVTAASEGLTYITAVDEQGKEIGRIYIRVR